MVQRNSPLLYENSRNSKWIIFRSSFVRIKKPRLPQTRRGICLHVKRELDINRACQIKRNYLHLLRVMWHGRLTDNPKNRIRVFSLTRQPTNTRAKQGWLPKTMSPMVETMWLFIAKYFKEYIKEMVFLIWMNNWFCLGFYS